MFSLIVASKTFYCSRLRHSLLLSNLQFLLFNQTSPYRTFSPKPNSNPAHNTSKSSLFTNPTTINSSKSSHFTNSGLEVLESLNSYANDWKLALECFDWFETSSGFWHNTQTFNKIIDILGKYLQFDSCWRMIDRMRKNPSSLPDHTTFRILFKRYLSAHLVNEAIDAFNKLDEFNLRDETSFSILIDNLCKYKHVIEAEELFFGRNKDVDVKTLGLDVESTKMYNMILRGWFKMESWAKARDFWEEMDRRGVQKDLYTYSTFMDIQCKSGKPWKAVKLYKEMRKKGMQLDVVAYNTVIRAIGIGEGVDMAVRLYRQMIELGCQPNVVTYNTIMKLLCDNGRYREAYNTFGVMIKKGCEPNVVTYNTFFTCIEKPREILMMFDRMIERGVRPRLDTYVMLLRKFCRWGFPRPVLVFWEKMEEHGVSPDASAYNALIDFLVNKGLVDMARKYDEEMFSKGLSPKPRAELATEWRVNDVPKVDS